MKPRKVRKKNQMVITLSPPNAASSPYEKVSAPVFSKCNGIKAGKNDSKQLNWSSAVLKIFLITAVGMFVITLCHHAARGGLLASLEMPWLANGIQESMENLDWYGKEFVELITWHSKELVKHLEWHDTAQYVVVFDAGSTGTRLHVYLFRPMEDGRGVEMASEVFKKISPGISDHAHIPAAVVAHLQTLIESARLVVPLDLHAVTPMIFKATAGLRLLKPDVGENLLKAIREHLVSSTSFAFNPQDVSILPGDDEGLFGWVTINYLLGNLKQGRDTVAVIDFGGGSVQVTYRVQPGELSSLEDMEQVQIFDLEYNLYTHSYLGQGLKAARFSILHSEPDGILVSACLPVGYVGKVGHEEREYTVRGPDADLPVDCWSQVKEFVQKSGFVPQPAVLKGQIYLIAFFFDVARDAGLIGEDEHEAILTYHDYLEGSRRVCGAPDWNNPFLCQDLTYVAQMLHNGLKIHDKQLHVVDQLNGGETSWTLGIGLGALSSSQLLLPPA